MSDKPVEEVPAAVEAEVEAPVEETAQETEATTSEAVQATEAETNKVEEESPVKKVVEELKGYKKYLAKVKTLAKKIAA
ncbi:unnamed protein product [Kuraishia capsulata CBS 1993]|uniref:Uncharacterized protein n=1 Tax=Kuraishia capsulata CBS 1993 TaxID=1382522 RepID=W6MJJ8_9ASCO|nr:uncharacterized protein KUCA_T00002423001 [Kuraishia capsulata CBS 1993]CDK26451.1 unnamed protein product [Kuraishia capsulata CBS 1993]